MHRFPFRVLTFALAALPAMAGGFLLKEQNPRAQGLSFAGVSAARGTGSMFFNPASIGGLRGGEASLGLSLVAPSSVFENGVATRNGLVPAPLQPVAGEASHGNVAKQAVLPSLAAAWSLSPDVTIGLGVHVPYGMVTEYDNNWVGRYHALKSSLKTLDIAPTIAWRFHEQWTLGASLVARHGEAELSSAVDFGTIGALKKVPGMIPGAADGVAAMKGDGWAWGSRLGLAWQPQENLRLGLGYQSATSTTLKGHATYGQVPTALAPFFPETGIKADMHLPSNLSLGLEWQFTSSLTLHAEVSRTGWATFEELRVRFDNGSPDNVTDEKWRNTYFSSLGLTWKASDKWSFRTGVAADQGAASDDHRTPRIPDGNRVWISAGAGWQVNGSFAVDFAATHLFVKDGPLNLQAGGPTSPDFLRGSLKGNTRNQINIVSVQGTWRF